MGFVGVGSVFGSSCFLGLRNMSRAGKWVVSVGIIVVLAVKRFFILSLFLAGWRAFGGFLVGVAL